MALKNPLIYSEKASELLKQGLVGTVELTQAQWGIFTNLFKNFLFFQMLFFKIHCISISIFYSDKLLNENGFNLDKSPSCFAETSTCMIL